MLPFIWPVSRDPLHPGTTPWSRVRGDAAENEGSWQFKSIGPVGSGIASIAIDSAYLLDAAWISVRLSHRAAFSVCMGMFPGARKSKTHERYQGSPCTKAPLSFLKIMAIEHYLCRYGPADIGKPTLLTPCSRGGGTFSQVVKYRFVAGHA